MTERGLVLFSGGQDSTTCLAWALARFSSVETVGFDYGQRHRIELDCRVAVIERLRREFPDWSGKLVELILEETHSCYLGNRTQHHAWGYGCGDCPACQLRRRGWEIFTGRAQ